MGEISDYYLDSHEYFGDDPFPESSPSQGPVCRNCGTSGLHWEKTDDRWRLFDSRGLHVCPVKPLPPKGPFMSHPRVTTPPPSNPLALSPLDVQLIRQALTNYRHELNMLLTSPSAQVRSLNLPLQTIPRIEALLRRLPCPDATPDNPSTPLHS